MKLFFGVILGLLLLLDVKGEGLDQSFIDELIRNVTDPPGGGRGVYSQSNLPPLPGWEKKYKSHIPSIARIGYNRYQVSAPHENNDKHFIEYVFVLDQDGILVFAENITSTREESFLLTFTLESDTAESLTPYLLCNIHGIWANDFPALTALGVRRQVEEIESRPDPLTPEVRQTKVKSHVVKLSQVDADRLRLSMPTHAVQDVDFSKPDNGHFIEAVWVRQVGGSKDVAYFRNVTLVEGQVDLSLQVMEHLLNQSFTSPIRLQAVAWCNIHGLWTSEEITFVPPLYWDIASSFGDSQGNTDNECKEEDGVFVPIDDRAASIHISLDVDLAQESKLLTRFTLPIGRYIG